MRKMAAASKVVSRLSSRLQPLAFNLNKKPPCPQLFPLQSTSPPLVSVSPSRLSRRLPLQLSSAVGSMMPLHSAIASASLVSSLPIESDSWALVPQGISLPL
uniref:Uncharacterized protein LOC103340977 n=1 Tax=Rhizophora mucronata TaxID=61149 RepID=A0A2P2J1Z4_RHIMU